MADIDKAMAEQVEDAEAHALADHGGKREQGSVRTLKAARGETADYLARRIARDRPDVLARPMSGAGRPRVAESKGSSRPV